MLGSADDETFATEQLDEEVEVLDPQVRQVDVLFAEPGQPGNGRHCLGALLRGEAVAPGQDPRIGALGILLGLGENGGQGRLPASAVEVRDGCVCREKPHVAAILGLMQADRPEVDDARDEDDSVEEHPAAGLQVFCQGCGADSAIRLARDELR